MKQDQLRLAISATLQPNSAPRVEKHMGGEFTVVPAVLVQEQVLNNNFGATFLPAKLITAEWADEWNGAPVVIHDHPKVRGQAVSARTPEIMDAYGVGNVYRAKAVNGQLKAEVWLDMARVEQLEELGVIVKALNEGKTVELSTGFNALAMEGQGIHNGKTYEHILHPDGADHLAIFVERTGACSVADGCGLGVQRETAIAVPEEAGNSVDSTEGEVMDGTVKDERIGFVNRCLDFLGNGDKVVPASLDEVVVSADTDEEVLEEVVETDNVLRSLLRQLKVADVDNAAISEVIGRSCECVSLFERGRNTRALEPEALEKLQAFATEREALMADNAEFSDQHRRRLLADLLQATYGSQTKYVWVDAVFTEGAYVVFGVSQENMVDQLFTADFMIAEDGKVTLAEPAAVTRRVVYDPVTNQEEETNTMKDDDKTVVDIEPVANAEVVDTPEAKPAVNADDVVETPEVTTEADGVETVTVSAAAFNALADEVKALREVTAPAVAEQARERTDLVEQLATNESVPFNKEELDTKTVDELRKLSSMVRGSESYAGRGGPVVATNADEQLFAEPVAYFDTKKGESE